MYTLNQLSYMTIQDLKNTASSKDWTPAQIKAASKDRFPLVKSHKLTRKDTWINGILELQGPIPDVQPYRPNTDKLLKRMEELPVVETPAVTAVVSPPTPVKLALPVITPVVSLTLGALLAGAPHGPEIVLTIGFVGLVAGLWSVSRR